VPAEATGLGYNCTDSIAKEIMLIAVKDIGSNPVSHVARRVLLL